MGEVFKSFAVGTDGKQYNVDLKDGVSFLAGTNTRVTSLEGWTVQTAGGIYEVKGGKGVLVANHNMIPVAEKQNPVITTVESKAQQNTVITPTGGPATNYPAPVATTPTTGNPITNALGLDDVVYLSDGSAQQNSLASMGIDNATLVTGGAILGGLLLFKWITRKIRE